MAGIRAKSSKLLGWEAWTTAGLIAFLVGLKDAR